MPPPPFHLLSFGFDSFDISRCVFRFSSALACVRATRQVFDPAAKRWIAVHHARDNGYGEVLVSDKSPAGACLKEGAGAGAKVDPDADGCCHPGVGEDETKLEDASVGSANPNEQDPAVRLELSGTLPGRRAGHSATVVGREVVVIGGSCASKYWTTVYALDTGTCLLGLLR